MTSDLVNDPSRPACGCDHCTLHAQAWAEGPILRRALIRTRIASLTTRIRRSTR